MKGFWHHLFGSSPELPAAVQEARADLVRLGEDRPTLAAHAQVVRDVLAVIFAEPVQVAVPDLTPEQVRASAEGGSPLLRIHAPHLDPTDLKKRWLAVCAAVPPQQSEVLAGAVRADPLLPLELLTLVLQGRSEEIRVRTEQRHLDPELTGTILRWMAFPILAQCQARLATLLHQPAWAHGSCPICGSWPALGELRGLEQAHQLRCGWCAADWPFPRLACPFCGTRDHQQLGYFHVEAQENSERVATCESCRGYLKTVTTLAPLHPAQLLVAEVGTLPLDLLAAERGYFVG